MKDKDAASLAAFVPLRIFSWVVVALMVIAMLYVGWLSLTNWTEIRV